MLRMRLLTYSLLLLAACGGDDGGTTHDAATPDAMADASGFSMTCTGACQTTALTAMMSATRVLDHAYFGITAADNTLHVEAYKGGAAGCPTISSPTPEYTLVLGRVTRPTSTAPSSSPGNILDYQGDLLGGPLGQQATTVTLTPVAASGDTFVAFDVMLTFPAGTVTGHFYATHCTSLDG
jgi:hypothetical protein